MLTKTFICLAMILLAACASPPPDGSFQPRPVGAASDAAESRPPSSNPSAASPSIPTCDSAFGAIAGEMARLPNLADAGSALDPTIAACETIDDWRDVATRFFTAMAVAHHEAEAFISARCAAASQLRAALLCSAAD